jgi:ribosome-associated protein
MAEADSELMIDATRAIPRDELSVKATRSGGAGGQHVNTSSTRIELSWRPGSSRVLSDDERTRVMARLASRIDGEGVIRIVASDTRSQAQNRELAGQRLAELVRKALVVPRKRKATKPSRAAKRARLDAKKRHSDKKKERRSGRWD